MHKSIIDKLSRFNPKRPYIWELKITEDEFCSLEEDLYSYTPDESKKDDALKILVYVAEWYKRRYTNRAKKDYQKTFGGNKPNLETVWRTLAIDEQYLYRGENNQKLYLYSTFILSGLSVQFELQKNEKPFLKSLCRVLNGEEDNYEVDTNHSIAFKESVRRGHCLDSFLKTIVKNINAPAELPFAIEDYNNADTRIKELTKLIKEINDSVQKSKFRLEWVFNAPQGDNLIYRYLHLWLNPNNGDFSKRHVFTYDDVREKWGIAKPEEQRYIRIGLSFLSKVGSHEILMVKRADSAHPACMFRNTGERYFIASEPDYVVVKDIPVSFFNLVQIVCWDDEGTEYPIVTEDVNHDAVQLYRIDKYEDLWTDRALPQRETVVLFSDKYRIAEESDDKFFEHKTLYNKKYGEGYNLCWCPVNIAVLLKDEKNEPLKPFVNKQTSNSISIHLYKESIVYSPDGKLTWIKKDIDSEEEEEDSICLITKKEDISVRFYRKSNSEDDEGNIEIISPETIEFKSTNGHYIEWTDDCAPKYGVNYIRVYARHQLINQNEVFPVFYLPKGICRDCSNRQISYISEKGLTITIDDSSEIQSYLDRKQVLPVTKTVILENGEDISLIVPVVRPVNLKEVCYDGRIFDYNKEGKVSIPYIIKNHVEVNVFNKEGYKKYCYKNFRNIYHEIRHGEYIEGGKFTNALENKEFKDEYHFPNFITVFVRNSLKKESFKRYLYWNFQKGTRPQQVKDLKFFDLPEGSVLFEDQRILTPHMGCECIEKEEDPFEIGNKEKSYLEIFLTANNYHQYFFNFEPLRGFSREISNDISLFFNEIFYPIYNREGLSEKNKEAMLRFSEEFDLIELRNKLQEEFINN